MPYFGWMKPSETKEKSFDISIEGDPLDQETYSEFERAAKFFAEIRRTLIDFLILSEEYGSLLDVPKQLSDIYIQSGELIQNSGALFIRSHVVADRAVTGFLSAGGTFRDRLFHRLSINTQSDHPVSNRLRATYDRSFAYRLCYNLRNFGQHVSAILNVIPISIKDLQGNPAVSVALALDRNRLIAEMEKAQPRLKADLKTQPDKIELLPIVTEYFHALRHALMDYVLLSADDLIFTMGFANVLEAGARGLPPGATPLLFKELPSAESIQASAEREFDFKAQIEHFSLDELGMLLKCLPELQTWKQQLKATQVQISPDAVDGLSSSASAPPV
ncbi:MAG TPA: hypothetical protein VF603_06335 [Allosphingosinicella sp.]|jgi:hypothetical protein